MPSTPGDGLSRRALLTWALAAAAAAPSATICETIAPLPPVDVAPVDLARLRRLIRSTVDLCLNPPMVMDGDCIDWGAGKLLEEHQWRRLASLHALYRRMSPGKDEAQVNAEILKGYVVDATARTIFDGRIVSAEGNRISFSEKLPLEEDDA